MTPKKLLKIKRQLKQMRASPYNRTSSDLISIAHKLGRVRDKRGKEPNYIRNIDPSLSPPLSIPGHAGELGPGITISIIDALLSDVDQWDIYLLGEDE